MLATRAQAKGIEILSSIPPALDATVKGDPSRLRQVLVNRKPGVRVAHRQVGGRASSDFAP